ncbi:hypothetical protein [Nocardia sp. NPDC059691]|uniref:hypothetical protein n=1 Tax=Nocardia sp. NPDC059691 TaxID=3346908 RepID=UPI0036B8D077
MGDTSPAQIPSPHAIGVAADFMQGVGMQVLATNMPTDHKHFHLIASREPDTVNVIVHEGELPTDTTQVMGLSDRVLWPQAGRCWAAQQPVAPLHLRFDIVAVSHVALGSGQECAHSVTGYLRDVY